MDRASVEMTRCVLGKHEEECIVGMGTSNVDLTDCHMHGSQGPAVDISGKARLSMSRGSIKECVGGVWMWDNSMCELVDVNLHGGTSHAIVTDNKAKIKLVVSVFYTPTLYVYKDHMVLACYVCDTQR